MTTIQVRMDETIKRESTKILQQLGLDMSSAITVYLNQIILTKGIPFPLLTENGLTIQQEREILEASREAKIGRNISKPTTKTDVAAYLDSIK